MTYYAFIEVLELRYHSQIRRLQYYTGYFPYGQNILKNWLLLHAKGSLLIGDKNIIMLQL